MAFSSTKTNRKLRNSIGAVFGTVPVATFSTFLWLFFSCSSSHPTQPHPELGLIHRLSNHGSYVYISDSEVTGLSLLMIGFLVGFMLAAAIIPKDFVPPP